MLAAIIAVFAIVFDQISKYFVVETIELHGEKPFIPYIMSFYHTQNKGAAFSMFSDNRWFFMVFSFVSMAIMLYLLIREYRRHPLLTVSLAMVLGGGIGNMIDRIRLGYVVDFLRFDFVDFAIFNVADSFITVGAVLMLIYIFFFDPKVEKRLREQAEKEDLEKESASQDEASESEASDAQKKDENG